MVHFAIDVGGLVRPLCGEWSGRRSWTKIRAAVTCPKCLALLSRVERIRLAA